MSLNFGIGVDKWADSGTFVERDSKVKVLGLVVFKRSLWVKSQGLKKGALGFNFGRRNTPY